MNNIPDYILDEALEQLRSGQPLATVLSSYPEYAQELEAPLSLASTLRSVRMPVPPTPVKRFKFAEVQKSRFGIMEFINMFRYAAIPLVLAIAFIGSNGLINATKESVPGQTLFSLKRAGEEARLNLTFDEQRVVAMQIELVQKRMDEAKRALASSDAEQQTAAIEALTKQTEKTFAAVSDIAATTAVSKNDPTLLNTLVAINKEQKSLVQTSGSQDNTKNLATATLANEKTLAKIIAAVNEQSLADLPNKITITGTVSNNGHGKITVEKNTFTITDETTITNSLGEILTDAIITGKITVIGTRSNNVLIAKKVVLFPEESTASTTPQVKGVVTTKTPTTTSSTSTTSTKQSEPTAEPEPTETTDVQKPNEATAGFIVETTEQLYTP